MHVRCVCVRQVLVRRVLVRQVLVRQVLVLVRRVSCAEGGLACRARARRRRRGSSKPLAIEVGCVRIAAARRMHAFAPTQAAGQAVPRAALDGRAITLRI